MREGDLDRFFSMMKDWIYRFVTDFFFQEVL